MEVVIGWSALWSDVFGPHAICHLDPFSANLCMDLHLETQAVCGSHFGSSGSARAAYSMDGA